MNNNTKKIAIGGGIAALLLSGGLTAFLVGKDDVGENNKPVQEDTAKNKTEETDKSKLPNLTEATVEYGTTVTGTAIEIEGPDGPTKVSYDQLKPKVDTFKVGEYDYKIVLKEEEFNIIVTVEDTVDPVIEGVKENFKFAPNTDITTELAKVITAKDPVDGALEVKFDIKAKGDSKTEFDVKATAEDKTGRTVEKKFTVTVESTVAKDDNKGDSNAVATKPNNSGNSGSTSGNTGGNTTSKPNTGGNNGDVTSTKPNTGGNTTAPAPTKPETKPNPAPAKPNPAPAKPNPAPTKPETKPNPAPAKPETKPNPAPSKPGGAQIPITYGPAKGQGSGILNNVDPNNLTYTNIPVITATGSVPGASLVFKMHGRIEYTYNKPAGNIQKINYVAVIGEDTGSLTFSMAGIDQNGKQFGLTVRKGSTSINYQFSAPDFSADDIDYVLNVANQFLNVHKP